MTEKDLRIITIILCCCLAAILIAAIVLGSLGLLNDKDKEPVDFSTLTYVALGDSITFGAQYPSGAAMDTPYPEAVGQILNVKAALNFGISGSTVCASSVGYYGMCERYAEMPDDADIVSVMGGVNDYIIRIPLGKFGDTDTTTFYGALNALAKGLTEKYPNAFIFFMTPLKFRGNEGVMGNGGTLGDYRNAVKRVCKKYGIAVLDAAVKADYSKAYNSENYWGDGLHPDQYFVSETLAPVIAEYIQNNYKVKPQ